MFAIATAVTIRVHINLYAAARLPHIVKFQQQHH